jgi:hypothetical protein
MKTYFMAKYNDEDVTIAVTDMDTFIMAPVDAFIFVEYAGGRVGTVRKGDLRNIAVEQQ